MAQVVSTSYVDDLDGSQASGAVDFSLDGKSYAIDLSDSNAARLRDALAPFVSAARRAGGSAQRRSAPARQASGRSREETQEIRSTLRGLGYSVKDRGRIPADLLAAYETRTSAPQAEKKSRKKGSAAGRTDDTDGKVVRFSSV